MELHCFMKFWLPAHMLTWTVHWKATKPWHIEPLHVCRRCRINWHHLTRQCWRGIWSLCSEMTTKKLHIETTEIFWERFLSARIMLLWQFHFFKFHSDLSDYSNSGKDSGRWVLMLSEICVRNSGSKPGPKQLRRVWQKQAQAINYNIYIYII